LKLSGYILIGKNAIKNNLHISHRQTLLSDISLEVLALIINSDQASRPNKTSKLASMEEKTTAGAVAAIQELLDQAEKELLYMRTKLDESKASIASLSQALAKKTFDLEAKHLSISCEKVSVRLSSGDRYQLLSGALLDTGNNNVCHISLSTAKLLGVKMKGLPKLRVEGVTPKMIANLPYVSIQVEIKGIGFINVTAAIGGEDSILISKDIIVKLMTRGYYIAMK
jgi:hypothetical protein